ncbi:Protein MON2 protein [Fasciola gigantica]|uniref:Protein MON2 protein n=1 Tax=Fasciola gigantica TaxID=46835 RepID=A0A504YGE0_FASGI|nr:Protein MON2 protein [Fasciola gigantica]
MAIKYACPSQSTWILACKCFLQVIPSAIPILTHSKDKRSISKATSLDIQDRDELCIIIADTFRDFLFYQHQPPSSLSIEDFREHEELDCKFVRVISDLFLSSSAELPNTFISRLVDLLSWGSVQASVSTFVGPGRFSSESNGLSAMPTSPSQKPTRMEHVQRDESINNTNSSTRRPSLKGLGMAVRQTESLAPPDPLSDGALSLELDLDRLRQFAFRENFARLCFSTLLCHAFSCNPSVDADDGGSYTERSHSTATSTTISVSVTRCAVRSILQRCRLTLVQFYQAACLTGKCPLPRARLAEIAYVFKALTVMLTSLRSVCAQRDVDPSTWHHVIDLYPHIVDCVLVTGGSQMTVALHRLLRLYGDLLRPACLDSPKDKDNAHNGI